MASIRNTKKAIKKIEVNDGDIIMLRCKNPYIMRQFQKAFSKKRLSERSMVFLVNSFADLKKATPELLKRLGLRRIEENADDEN